MERTLGGGVVAAGTRRAGLVRVKRERSGRGSQAKSPGIAQPISCKRRAVRSASGGGRPTKSKMCSALASSSRAGTQRPQSRTPCLASTANNSVRLPAPKATEA